MFALEEKIEGGAIFRAGDRRLRLRFITSSTARVTYTSDKPFLERESRIIIGKPDAVECELRGSAERWTLRTEALSIELDKQTGALSYFDSAQALILREPQNGGKWLTPKPVTRNIFPRNTTVELGQSIDGARAVAREYKTIFDRTAFEAKLEFEFAADEALFGLGSHEEGYGNLRGRSRELYQQNMKAVVPHLVSTRGYGVLFDCGSLMTFHDDAHGSYVWADTVDELDFYFIYGGSFDGVIRGYRQLTGTPPLPPKWAFGYVQSKERYVTAQEMLDVVREYRRRRTPLDVIVLDWKSWPNGGGWGQKSLDPHRFPDPEGFTRELHALGAKLMVSIWPIMTGGADNQRELLDRDLMLGNQSTYNAFLPDARAAYWQQARTGLFQHGVDAWWCDCTEPFEADWSGAVKPEPHARLGINTSESKLYLDAAEINEYSLLHSQAIYEGQRSATDAKRVLNLTRSAYAGQSRYGTFTWNGDVCATWETLRRSIAEGLNFCATGEPYWTVDIGGFFVGNRPDLWFWSGDYNAGTRGLTDMNAVAPDPHDTGSTDLGFAELYTRWLQYATFLPMFRSHGTDAAREIWRFGEAGTPFYDAIAESIRLRYKLMPYIYSVAAQVTFAAGSMIRALALEFPEDRLTHSVADEFLFGPSLLVAPITRPMYFEKESRPISTERTREVHLPAGTRWYDFWSGSAHEGGTIALADAPLERIPLFVRAGSIVPMTTVMQFVDEVRDAPWELHVFSGADAEFTIYEDAGDGYAYERGERARVRVTWNECARELFLHSREGTFPELVRTRVCQITLHSQSVAESHRIEYAGDVRRVSFTNKRKNDQDEAST